MSSGDGKTGFGLKKFEKSKDREQREIVMEDMVFSIFFFFGNC
jgi:hypothetical protein